jgi:spore maturation protein CgeB
MKKKRILFAYLAYPFCIASYFRCALEKRSDIDVVTCGAFTGDYIPWNGGMRLPMRYVRNVDLKLPPNLMRPSWRDVERGLQQKFDLVINVDAGFHFRDKPDVPYAVIGTDPHVLNDWYDDVRPRADYFFNMQEYYKKDGDIVLPYACSPDHHYPMPEIEKVYDASLVGLHYENRNRLVSELRRRGYNVYYDIGLVWDEYRVKNNQAWIGLNWSSLYDINARTFEMMAMGQIPVINRLPFLENLGLIENQHYLGFENVEEAVFKVEWALKNLELAKKIAENARWHVIRHHTYNHRVEQILTHVFGKETL